MRKSRAPIRAIIFDLDGVLLNNAQVYFEAGSQALDELNEHVSKETIFALVKAIENGYTNLEPWMSQEKCKEYVKAYGQIWNKLCIEKSSVRKDVMKCLAGFRREFDAKLGLVTGRRMPFAEIQAHLDSLGLGDYFDTIVTRDQENKTKPNAAQLLLASKNISIEQQACAAVGDMPADVVAAKNAGMLSVAVLSGIYSRADFAIANPDCIFNDVSKMYEKRKSFLYD